MTHTYKVTKISKHKKKKRKLNKMKKKKSNIFLTKRPSPPCKHFLLSQKLYKRFRQKLKAIKKITKLVKEIKGLSFDRTAFGVPRSFPRVTPSGQRRLERSHLFFPSALKVSKPISGLPKSGAIALLRKNLLWNEGHCKSTKKRKLFHGKLKHYIKKGNLKNLFRNAKKRKTNFKLCLAKIKKSYLKHKSERFKILKKINEDKKKKSISLVPLLLKGILAIRDTEVKRLLLWTRQVKASLVSKHQTQCQSKINEELLNVFATVLKKIMKKSPGRKKITTSNIGRRGRATQRRNRSQFPTPQGNSRSQFSASRGNSRSQLSTPRGNSRSQFSASRGNSRSQSSTPRGNSRSQFSTPRTNSRSQFSTKRGNSRSRFRTRNKYVKPARRRDSILYERFRQLFRKKTVPRRKNVIRRKSARITTKKLLRYKRGMLVVTRITRGFRKKKAKLRKMWPKVTNKVMRTCRKLRYFCVKNLSHWLSNMRRFRKKKSKRSKKRHRSAKRPKLSPIMSCLLKREAKIRVMFNNLEKGKRIMKEIKDKRMQNKMKRELFFRKQKLRKKLMSVTRKQKYFLRRIKLRKKKRKISKLHANKKQFIERLEKNKRFCSSFLQNKTSDFEALPSAIAKPSDYTIVKTKGGKKKKKYPHYRYRLEKFGKCRCPQRKTYVYPKRRALQGIPLLS